MSKVSVIVCCYNGEQYIEKCFNCLLDQTHKDIEVLFVDDGSTDNSYEEAQKYIDLFRNNGSELKCFHQENKGAGGAAALALFHSTGQYISCYDVDDIIYPTSIEKRSKFLDDNIDYSVVRTNGYRVNSADESRTLFVVSEEEKQKTDIFRDLLLGRTNNWSGSYMVRASELWKVYPDRKMIESRFGQNLQILLVASYNNKSAFIDEPLMEYVYNPVSFTHIGKGLSFQISNYEGFLQIRKSILEKLNICDAQTYNALYINHYKRCLDSAITYNDKAVYELYYTNYCKLISPDIVYRYHHYKYNNSKIKEFFCRILVFINYRLCVLTKLYK